LGSSRLGDDVLRWVRWLKAGLPGDVWGHPWGVLTFGLGSLSEHGDMLWFKHD
jgi:hypothetical protein